MIGEVQVVCHLPNMHEHVAEEAPHLGTVARVVDQGALHEVRLVCLQNPLVQHDPITHEHNDLWRETNNIILVSVPADMPVNHFFSTEYRYKSQEMGLPKQTALGLKKPQDVFFFPCVCC